MNVTIFRPQDIDMDLYGIINEGKVDAFELHSMPKLDIMQTLKLDRIIM